MRRSVTIVATRALVLSALGFAAGVGLGLLFDDPPAIVATTLRAGL